MTKFESNPKFEIWNDETNAGSPGRRGLRLDSTELVAG
jgi:hypothetical protein